jgi:hypothetical protein
MAAELERAAREVIRRLRDDSSESLVRTRRDVSAEDRTALEAEAEGLIGEAAYLIRAFRLDPPEESLAGVLNGRLSVLWSDAEELRPKRLKAYGPVDPSVTEPLESAIDRISDHLDRMFRRLSSKKERRAD